MTSNKIRIKGVMYDKDIDVLSLNDKGLKELPESIELEKIQIKDIKDITKRIEFNYKIFEETNNFINKKQETIKHQELELQELKDKLENEKNKFQAQIINIKNINDKIINYTSLIKKYMNSDYQSI
jgi:signal recognition particle subunit SEC65